MDHPGDRDLKGLLSGRLAKGARRRAVRHLLAGCGECRARLRQLVPEGMWSAAGAPDDAAAYDACLDRAAAALGPLTARWEEERGRRERGIALVPAAERKSSRGRWSQVEVLLELSSGMRYRDPERMLELALAAQRAADRLRPTKALPAALLYDLRARAAAEVANAERVNEGWVEAELAVETARSFLERGSGDLLVKARIDEVEASLWNARRHLELAEVLLDRAYRLYRRLGERHFAGRTLVTKGICRRLAERPVEAVAILHEAVELLGDCPDPKLVASAQQSLLDALVDAGEIAEAAQLLRTSGLRRTFADDPLNRLRLRWVEGKILLGRDRLVDAERALREVRDGFRARGLEYVAAVAGLDVAKVLLRQGELGKLYQLSTELKQRVIGAGLPAAARQALLTFELLCEARVALAVYAERVQRFLRRLEHDPLLEWQVEMIAAG